MRKPQKMESSNITDFISKTKIDELPKRYFSKGFSNLVDVDEDFMQKKQICLDYANGKLDEKCLVLAGGVGGGKTHLAVAVAKNIPEKLNYGMKIKSFVRFLVADELFTMFNDLVFRKESKIDFINNILLADLIVIDDLGIANFTPAKQENLYLLINGIYLKEKRLILTTNFTMEKLSAYDERITSRLTEMSKMLLFKQKDYRKKTHN